MLEQGRGVRDISGATGKSLTEGFVTIQTAGIRELAKKLEDMAAEMNKPNKLKAIVASGARMVGEAYKNNITEVTGNLKASVKVRTKQYSEASVAIVGPMQTGPFGSTDEQASGNHAWMVEWGTDRRRPGTNNRRTYLNVHQMINGKMTRHSTANDQQFANMSKGYYFLMGSRNEPTRQAKAGAGYPHDFGFTNGRHHPVTLHPGEDYGAMPAKHPMERAIASSQQAVFNHLKSAIQNTINGLTQ